MDLEIVMKEIADAISLTPTQIQESESKRRGLENYFKNQNAPIEMYIQGSFSLGTAIQPVKKDKDGDFDLDIVCEVNSNLNRPHELKNYIGDILKKSKYKEYLCEEGRRCWTLEYERFHIDILPAIKDTKLGPTFILIANKNKETNIYNYLSSNPKSFTKWFLNISNSINLNQKNNQKSVVFNKNKLFFQESMKYTSWNEVSDIFLSSTLQNTVKILKRHRDNVFVGKSNEDYKPISVIITTIAAQITYKYKLDKIGDIINKTVSNYTDFIETTVDGKYRVINPVDPKENFADKWHEDNRLRYKMFIEWIAQLKEFITLVSSQDTTNSGLKKYLSESVSNAVIAKLNEKYKEKNNQVNTSKPWIKR